MRRRRPPCHPERVDRVILSVSIVVIVLVDRVTLSVVDRCHRARVDRVTLSVVDRVIPSVSIVSSRACRPCHPERVEGWLSLPKPRSRQVAAFAKLRRP
ncbi:MAG: hypothetical protein ACXVA3_04835, partial [Vulcanimicrobiaceae bacterium]